MEEWRSGLTMCDGEPGRRAPVAIVAFRGSDSPLAKALQQQAANNSRARFLESPDLESEVIDAVLSARTAHQHMSDQALEDPSVMKGLVNILVNFTELYDQLRQRAKAG